MPASITTMPSADSTTVMFLPISPIPPSGMTRTMPGAVIRAASRPRRASAARTTARSSSVAATSGSRGSPTAKPEHLDRGLDRNRVDRDRRAPRTAATARHRARGRARGRPRRRPRPAPACRRRRRATRRRCRRSRRSRRTAPAGRRCRRRARARRRRSRRAWSMSVVACLTAITLSISARRSQQLGRQVDDHALRDVVDDDRQVVRDVGDGRGSGGRRPRPAASSSTASRPGRRRRRRRAPRASGARSARVS